MIRILIPSLSFRRITLKQLVHGVIAWENPIACRFLGHLHHKWRYRGTYESFMLTCSRCPHKHENKEEMTKFEHFMSRLEYNLREPERM